MNTSMIMKATFIGALSLSATVFASAAEKESLGAPTRATCNCKNAADCTCAKGQCKCKKCGNGNHKRVFESLKGSSETTRLPDTARYEDARGGVFI